MLAFVKEWNDTVEESLTVNLKSKSIDIQIESLKNTIGRLNGIIMDKEKAIVEMELDLHNVRKTSVWMDVWKESQQMKETLFIEREMQKELRERAAMGSENFHVRLANAAQAFEERLRQMGEEQMRLRDEVYAEKSLRLDEVASSQEIVRQIPKLNEVIERKVKAIEVLESNLEANKKEIDALRAEIVSLQSSEARLNTEVKVKAEEFETFELRVVQEKKELAEEILALKIEIAARDTVIAAEVAEKEKKISVIKELEGELKGFRIEEQKRSDHATWLASRPKWSLRVVATAVRSIVRLSKAVQMATEHGHFKLLGALGRREELRRLGAMLKEEKKALFLSQRTSAEQKKKNIELSVANDYLVDDVTAQGKRILELTAECSQLNETIASYTVLNDDLSGKLADASSNIDINTKVIIDLHQQRRRLKVSAQSQRATCTHLLDVLRHLRSDIHDMNPLVTMPSSNLADAIRTATNDAANTLVAGEAGEEHSETAAATSAAAYRIILRDKFRETLQFVRENRSELAHPPKLLLSFKQASPGDAPETQVRRTEGESIVNTIRGDAKWAKSVDTLMRAEMLTVFELVTRLRALVAEHEQRASSLAEELARSSTQLVEAAEQIEHERGNVDALQYAVKSLEAEAIILKRTQKKRRATNAVEDGSIGGFRRTKSHEQIELGMRINSKKGEFKSQKVQEKRKTILQRKTQLTTSRNREGGEKELREHLFTRIHATIEEIGRLEARSGHKRQQGEPDSTPVYHHHYNQHDHHPTPIMVPSESIARGMWVGHEPATTHGTAPALPVVLVAAAEVDESAISGGWQRISDITEKEAEEKKGQGADECSDTGLVDDGGMYVGDGESSVSSVDSFDILEQEMLTKQRELAQACATIDSLNEDVARQSESLEELLEKKRQLEDQLEDSLMKQKQLKRDIRRKDDSILSVNAENETFAEQISLLRSALEDGYRTKVDEIEKYKRSCEEAEKARRARRKHRGVQVSCAVCGVRDRPCDTFHSDHSLAGRRQESIIGGGENMYEAETFFFEESDSDVIITSKSRDINDTKVARHADTSLDLIGSLNKYRGDFFNVDRNRPASAGQLVSPYSSHIVDSAYYPPPGNILRVRTSSVDTGSGLGLYDTPHLHTTDDKTAREKRLHTISKTANKFSTMKRFPSLPDPYVKVPAKASTIQQRLAKKIAQ